MLLARTPLFVVCGFVEDDAVEARWVPGYGLVCSSVLLERGETFPLSKGGPHVVAALDTPVAAMLTVVRAMSLIRSLEVATSSPGWVPYCASAASVSSSAWRRSTSAALRW